MIQILAKDESAGTPHNRGARSMPKRAEANGKLNK
jgi:hypothetical protein